MVGDNSEYVEILDIVQWCLAQKLPRNGRCPVMVIRISVHQYGDDGRFGSGPHEIEPVGGVLRGREV